MNIWLKTFGSDLEQGDFLPDCALPMVGPDFETDDRGIEDRD